MPTSLDEIRARFGADRPAPKPDPEVVAALGRLKQGKCPSCGKPTFKTLKCRSCGFDASQSAEDHGGSPEELDPKVLAAIQKSPGEVPDKEDVHMARIAAEAALYLARPPQPEETESSDDHIKDLETEIAKQTALRTRARAIRQQISGDKGGRFTIETSEEGGGRDAILQFGNYKGQRVSELRLQPESSRYLRWILDEQFNPVLKEIIREQLGLPRQDDE